MDHPLSLGKLKASAPIVFVNSGTQKIFMRKIEFKNESSENQLLTVNLICRGTINILCSNSTLLAGYSRDMLEPGKDLTLDPGDIIMGYCPNDNKIAFLVDGDEFYDSRLKGVR